MMANSQLIVGPQSQFGPLQTYHGYLEQPAQLQHMTSLQGSYVNGLQPLPIIGNQACVPVGRQIISGFYTPTGLFVPPSVEYCMTVGVPAPVYYQYGPTMNVANQHNYVITHQCVPYFVQDHLISTVHWAPNVVWTVPPGGAGPVCVPNQHVTTLEAPSRTRGRKKCIYCLKNGQHDSMVSSHNTFSRNNKVQCPLLRRYVCSICGKTGDEAHTAKYCPVLAAYK